MVSRIGVRVLLVATLLVLAGCSGVANDEPVDRDPYGVDEPIEPSATAGIPITGPEDSEFGTWEDLWMSHVETLETNAYERTSTLEVVDANGTVIRSETTRTVRAENGTMLVEQVRERPDSSGTGTEQETVTQWTDDDRSLVRTTADNETTIEEGRALDDHASAFPVHPDSLFISVESVTAVETDDSTRHVLRGSGVVAPYENATFTAIVDGDGYLEGLAVEGDVRHRVEAERATVEWRLDSVGEPTELDRPDWVEAAAGGDADDDASG